MICWLPPLDLSKSWWDRNSIKGMSIGGKAAAVIGDFNFYSAIAPTVVYANKKLMQDYGFGDLYQTAREGKWTWDIMHELARAAAKDLNGDGVISKEDQVGLAMSYWHLEPAITCARTYITPKNSGDIPEYAPDNGRIADITSKVVAISKDKSSTMVSEDVNAGYGNVFFELLLPKFINNEILFNFSQLQALFDLRNMDADFAILPFPKYDENQENYGSIVQGWWGTFTVIPITCADIDKTANILQALGYYSQQYVTHAYYDVTVTNKLIRDEGTAEMMDIILNNRVFDLSYFYRGGGMDNVIFEIASKGQPDTIVSQFEKNENRIKSAIQKTLDELEIN